MPPTRLLARDHYGATQLAFCLSHARRKFVEAYKTTGLLFAHEVIERLQAVYAIEAEIRGSNAEQRLAVRRAQIARLMETLTVRLTEIIGQLFSPNRSSQKPSTMRSITGRTDAVPQRRPR